MLSRREVLVGSALSLFLARCTCTPKPATLTPLERWQALLAALRQSPDHLAAAADAAVASKDPALIFAFVRDQIATVPPLGNDPLETAVRFGVDNLLRSGAGTPRERAELLVRLLQRAGLSASVVKGDPDGALFDAAAPRKVYLRTVARPFKPGPPVKGTWADTAPSGSTVREGVDAGGVDSAALFAALRPLLPAAAAAATPYLGSFFGMPLVAVDVGGQTTYLNPLLPDAAYGEGSAHGLAPAGPLAAARTVTVRLSATRARAPEAHVTLAESTFGWDELAGCRLRFNPQPTLPLPLFLSAKAPQVTNFVAGFALLASNGALKRFVPGLAFSAFGDVVEVGAGGATVSGVPLAAGGDAGAVSALAVEASAHQQPIIELRVAPTDAAARVVAGLAASNFAVQEDGVRVSAVVRENGAAARVLLLWDCTGSQPALTDPMAAGLVDAVFAAAPGASAQVTALDGAAAASGFTLTTPAAVKQALLAVSGATSPVYAGLMSALAAAPTLVVLFTDGNAEPLPALASQCLAALGSCPVLAVGCHGASAATRPEVLQPIAAASGGAFVDGGDLSDLTATRAGLAAVAGRRSALPYRLAYASRGGAGVHHVQVRVGPASAGADFTLTGSPAASSEFVGVHLRLEMDGTLAERTLVGLAPAAIPAAADVAAQLAQASQAVRDFFLSSAWITFEGGAPTLSAWLDDALSATIAREPLNEAVRAKDAAGAYAAAESAPTAPPLRSLLAHAPLPQPDGTPVVEAALRAAVHLTLPLSRTTSVDLLPTTRFVTLGAADDQATFAATMRASLRLAVAESAMSLGSTRSALAGVALAAIPPGFVNPADLAAFPQAVRESFTAQLERHHDAWRLVAADGSRRAFWAVDRATGTALGVLPDGTGGAIESCQEIVEYAQLAIDALGILLAQIDTGLAPTFTFIAAVGKAASVAVAEAALSFTDPLIDPSILQLGATVACSVGSDLVGDHLPLPGGMTGVENAFLQNLGGGTIMDQNPICQAATPCTKTAPPP